MDFGLSEEQRLLQDTLRGFLRERVPVARVRELGTADPDATRELWGELAALGIAGVLIPDDHGGSGLALLDAALAAEQLGAAVTPTPFLGSADCVPIALREAGSPAQRKEWLPRLATGTHRIGVALHERVGRREGAGVRRSGDRLSGKTLFAIDTPGAEVVLVGCEDGSLVLVAADAPGVEVEALATIDRTRSCAELRFDGAPVAEVLEDGDPGATAERVLDAGRAILAADTLGACQAMLDQAVVYARQRRQFGREIASFQAVKHMCAEMAAELEPARSLCWYAAHALDAVPADAPLAVALAKSHLGEIGAPIADLATQVHGGIGYTDEQNLHLWFKRIGLNRQLLGGPEWLRERAARLQGLEHAPRGVD